MSAPVDALEQRARDANEPLEEILPAAITLALMVRHRTMASWLRTEFAGYGEEAELPPYRQARPGHLVAKSPQYGWIPAPVDEKQHEEDGCVDMSEGVRSLEKTCLACKKGSGKQLPLDPERMAVIQSHINLNAEIAVTVSRQTYSDLLRLIRATVYLWAVDLMNAGFGGERNAFSASEREQAADMDTPEAYWRRAMDEVDSLPVPGVREAGFFERVFGNA